jgi:hypothetical protein
MALLAKGAVHGIYNGNGIENREIPVGDNQGNAIHFAEE